MSQAARKAAIVAGTSAVALTGLAAPAQAAELTLNYKCEYPLIGARLLTVEIDTNIPAEWPKGVPTDVWDINALSIAKEQTLTGLQLVAATSVEGTALAKSTVNLPGGVALPVDVPINVPNTPAVGDANGDLVLNATGQTPALTFPTAGQGNITVDGIQLNLIARKADGTPVDTFSQIQPGPATDNDPATFDVYCVLDPANQSTVLKDITITDPNEPEDDWQQPEQPGPGSASNITDKTATLSWGASIDNVGVVAYDVYNGLAKLGESATPSIDLTGLTPNTNYTIQVVARDAAGNISDERVITFKTLAAADTTPPSVPTGLTGTPSQTSVNLSWTASTDNVGVTGYEVFRNGTKIADVTGTSYSATGLTAGTQYSFTVRAKDAAGNLSGQSQAVSVTTLPAGGNTIIDYSYTLTGNTVLRTLTAGTLPLSGSLDAKLTLETQKFEADLKLNATKGNLKALGFLPVSATVSFTNAAKTTGAVATNGSVTANSKVNIRLSSVNVFGIPLVAGNCRTQKPSDINLKSASGFDVLKGGRLTGTYSISNLIDCGPLTVIVSPLTSGSGNQITVDLVKKP